MVGKAAREVSVGHVAKRDTCRETARTNRLGREAQEVREEAAEKVVVEKVEKHRGQGSKVSVTSVARRATNGETVG